jgi:hypothetical protein
MKYLYKYPQGPYPYDDLVEDQSPAQRAASSSTSSSTPCDARGAYFDVFVEYAKAAPDDILVQITAANRGPAAGRLHVLPTLWFRNDVGLLVARPHEKAGLSDRGTAGAGTIAATHPTWAVPPVLRRRGAPALHENETNNARLFPSFRTPVLA